MPRYLLYSLCCLATLSAYAAPVPLTTNEIGLMIRTGYTSKTILEELANRRFADSFDATKEAQLLRAGASPELVIALKSGRYAVTAQELAAAQEKKEAEAKRRAAAEEESKKFNTLYRARMAEARASQPMQAQPGQHVIYDQLKGDLVQFQNGAVNHFEDSGLASKKYFLLYFSAHWCGPCRKFTPGLVNYYNDMVTKHPEVELIFVSADKSPFGMETYMREANMPWPAIDFQKRSQKAGIQKYAGQSIPHLVLVDSNGNVLADSLRDEQKLGPQGVLQALDTRLAGGKSVAQGP
ncbi:MAG TPA: thioredoxin-like domain-containing protein [Chthoniobacterales bacterium]|nr:thioredoxin-like domain-containing protein [Chthoniobacterales bacterium]